MRRRRRRLLSLFSEKMHFMSVTHLSVSHCMRECIMRSFQLATYYYYCDSEDDIFNARAHTQWLPILWMP